MPYQLEKIGSAEIDRKFDDQGRLHCDDGPAVIHHGIDGYYQYSWFLHGVAHNSGGPCFIIKSGDRIIFHVWAFDGENKTDEVDQFLRSNDFGISENWEKWTDNEKLLFKMIWC